MTRAFRSVVPLILVSILVISCGGKTGEKTVETETLQPMEIFVQGVGLEFERVAFSSDDSRVITSGSKGTTIWDLSADREVKTVPDGEVRSMASSKSGRYLMTYGHGNAGNIHIYDFLTSTLRSLRVIPQERLFHGSSIAGFCITDDEKRFVLETDNLIKVFDMETLGQVHEIRLKERHYLFDDRKSGMSFIPGTDDLLIISYDISVAQPDSREDGKESQFLISVYDLAGGEAKFNYSLKNPYIQSWAISRDGKKLALLFLGKQVRIIDLQTGEHSDRAIATEGEVASLGYADDNTLTFAGRDGVVGTYDCEKRATKILETRLRAHFVAPSCNDLAISDDGTALAFCNGFERLLVISLPSREIKMFGNPAVNILGSYFDADARLNVLTPTRAFMQSGSHVGARDIKTSGLGSLFGNQVRIDDPKTGESLIFDPSLAKTIYSGKFEDEDKSYVSFTKDGKYAFFRKLRASGEETDKTIFVERLGDAAFRPVRLENSDQYWEKISAFDDNTKVMMSGGDSDLLGIWDMPSGKFLRNLNEQPGSGGTFEFLDRTMCLVGTQGKVKLYDLSDGQVRKTFTSGGNDGGNRDIDMIALTKDKKRFATADASGRVTIWDMDKEREVKSFQAHREWITSLGFSPDGRWIVSGSFHGRSTVVSDVSTGKELVKFVSFADGEWAMITPEGFFTASANGRKYLNVRTGLYVHSIDGFFDRFHNPSYVASVLPGK